MITKEAFDERRRALAPPGPFARYEAGLVTDLAARDSYAETLRRDAMGNLRRVMYAVADYRLAASVAGETAIADALFERELFLRALTGDGVLPDYVVQEQACVLTDVDCALPDWPGCGAAERLRWIAGMVCADPSQALPSAARRSSGSTLPAGHEGRWTGIPDDQAP